MNFDFVSVRNVELTSFDAGDDKAISQFSLINRGLGNDNNLGTLGPTAVGLQYFWSLADSMFEITRGIKVLILHAARNADAV